MLSARAHGEEKRRQIQAMTADANVVVAVCQWLHDALELNGVPKEKLMLSRQGLAPAFMRSARAAASARATTTGPLRALYLGRWDSTKGIDVIVKAIRQLPGTTPVELSIRAIQSSSGEIFEKAVRKLADGDRRITIQPAVDRSDLPEIFADHDVLVVPSRWLETGPMVVLEALSAGLYILGSNMGGIAEILTNSDNGELIDHENIAKWSEAVLRLSHLKSAGDLVKRPSEVRSIDTVAQEMAEVYRQLAGVK
jgi:glycosyltransferase involved in cell wall biosynthesis